MVRWGFWGGLIGLVVLATLLPSWRPEDRLFFGVIVLGTPTLFGVALGWLLGRRSS